MWTAQNPRAEKKFQEGDGEYCEKRRSEKGAAESIDSTPGRAGERPGSVHRVRVMKAVRRESVSEGGRAEDAGRVSASLENFDPEKLKVL